VLFVLFAYATVTGLHDNMSSIGRSSVPFLTVADHELGGAAVLAWVAGILSVLAALVAGSSSQARMLFDGGRSGLLPARLGRLRQPSETPVNALIFMAAAGLGIIGIWWIIHLITGHLLPSACSPSRPRSQGSPCTATPPPGRTRPPRYRALKRRNALSAGKRNTTQMLLLTPATALAKFLRLQRQDRTAR
jgi:Amino acid permease